MAASTLALIILGSPSVKLAHLSCLSNHYNLRGQFEPPKSISVFGPEQSLL